MIRELSDQLKPIYAQIGAVVQASQQMEMGIGFSLTLLKQLASEKFLDADFNGSMDVFSKRTLGRLISGLHKTLNFDKDMIAVFQLALEERNYVIHKLFSQDVEKFTTKAGRDEIKARIRQARENMDKGIKVLDRIVIALLEMTGLSIEELMDEVQKKIEL